MRSPVTLFLLTALVAPAIAQAEAPDASKHRVTWEERFALANTTQDGNLTLSQAKIGYPSIARHFSDIDSASKGFVTVADIRLWHKAQSAARHLSKATPEDPLRPRPAYQRMSIDQRQVNASANQVVKLPPQESTTTADGEAKPSE